MENIKWILVPCGLFLLWGGFFVNLPLGNWFWFGYDMMWGTFAVAFPFIIPKID